ncbi:MAG TPA: hypothetical protein VFC53_05010 [Dehalococcoidia bacterium]|nr:hypothetical protein [Dehalococcoidia bacterium]
MHLLWKRYTRSGYAPPWFYALAVLGFAGLTAWALVRGDWLIAAIAALMIAVTVGGARLMRRLSTAAEESRRHFEREDRHG